MSTADIASPRLMEATPLGDGAAIRDLYLPKPLLRSGRNWTAWFGPLISLALLATVFMQLGSVDFALLLGLVPRTFTFWAVFALTYSLTPLFDWFIFNRLWSIPAGGLAALFRKRLSNELLLGYVATSISTRGRAGMCGWTDHRSVPSKTPRSCRASWAMS